MLSCQQDTTLYTSGNKVKVEWLPPVVTDNNNVSVAANGSMGWGSELGLGRHSVRYTVEDAAGNLEGCGFVITVKKEGEQNTGCQLFLGSTCSPPDPKLFSTSGNTSNLRVSVGVLAPGFNSIRSDLQI